MAAVRVWASACSLVVREVQRSDLTLPGVAQPANTKTSVRADASHPHAGLQVPRLRCCTRAERTAPPPIRSSARRRAPPSVAKGPTYMYRPAGVSSLSRTCPGQGATVPSAIGVPLLWGSVVRARSRVHGLAWVRATYGAFVGELSSEKREQPAWRGTCYQASHQAGLCYRPATGSPGTRQTRRRALNAGLRGF